MNKQIERLKKIRKKISKIYLEIGNFEFLRADGQLNKDIKQIEKLNDLDSKINISTKTRKGMSNFGAKIKLQEV